MLKMTIPEINEAVLVYFTTGDDLPRNIPFNLFAIPLYWFGFFFKTNLQLLLFDKPCVGHHLF